MKIRNYHPFNIKNVCTFAKKMRMRIFIDNERKETDYVLSHPLLLEAIAKSEKELEQGCFVAQQANETISQFLDRITVKPTEK